VLDTTIVAGQATGRCRATLGRVEVCNATYGRNGWLGVAQIWLSDGHIAQGTVKLNDTYFNTPTYNTSAWRNLVSCQEVGHTFGLDHQDENFDNANLGTCMDYTRDPDGGGAYGPGNEHPNQGDYDELLCIYDPAYSGKTLSTTTHSCKGTGHLDSTTSVGAAAGPGASGLAGKPFGAEGPNIPADFGTPAGPRDSYGRPILFERDLGAGQRLFTWVFWALP
jgi:hypothetical protein